MTPLVLVTGLSGAGKASILRALEDVGYEAVDNPPLTLVETLVSRGDRALAIGLDARSHGFEAQQVLATVDRLRELPNLRTELVFATAEPAVLLRRYTETRRRHPLAPDGQVIDGVEREVKLTLPLRDAADLVVDTSELPLPRLRRLVEERFGLLCGPSVSLMTVTLVSFAFPAGLPREADMVFDARFLRNPHYDPILRSRTGFDAEVAAYVEADPDYEVFFASILGMLQLVLPRFVQEGKKYATIAVGCTGGRHRSVCTVERLAPILAGLAAGGRERTWQVTTLHRELVKRGEAAAMPQGPLSGPENSPGNSPEGRPVNSMAAGRSPSGAASEKV